MPYAEFTPSNLGSTGSVWQNADAFSSMVARSQAVAQSKQQFPLLQQQLAGQIILNSQSQEMNNLAIQKQLAQAALIPSGIEAQRQADAASIAVSHATIASKNAEAQMTQAAMDDYPSLMGSINSITGGGSATAPVPVAASAAPDTDDGQEPDASHSPAADPVAAARSAAGLPPTAGSSSTSADPSPPDASPAAISYATVKKASDAVAVYKARYGSIPAMAPVMGMIDAKMASVSQAYATQLYSNLPAYGAAVRAATSTSDLLKVGADPDFDHALALPGDVGTALKDDYDKKFQMLSTQENQAKEKAAEAANQQAQQAREIQAQKDQQARQVAADQAKVQEQRNFENAVPPGNGFTGVIQGSATDASTFKTQLSSYNNANTKFGELLALNDAVSANPALKLDPTTRTQATVVATELQGALKDSIVGGKLTDRDITFLQAIAKTRLRSSRCRRPYGPGSNKP